MIGLNLGTSTKLAIIRVINPRVLPRRKPNLQFDLSYFHFLW